MVKCLLLKIRLHSVLALCLRLFKSILCYLICQLELFTNCFLVLLVIIDVILFVPHLFIPVLNHLLCYDIIFKFGFAGHFLQDFRVYYL